METYTNLNDTPYINYNIEPTQLIDETSSTEIYLGYSENGGATGGALWKIKRISKIGTVWHFEFPNGDQNYKYIWDDRFGYTYSL